MFTTRYELGLYIKQSVLRLQRVKNDIPHFKLKSIFGFSTHRVNITHNLHKDQIFV